MHPTRSSPFLCLKAVYIDPSIQTFSKRNSKAIARPFLISILEATSSSYQLKKMDTIYTPLRASSASLRSTSASWYLPLYNNNTEALRIYAASMEENTLWAYITEQPDILKALVFCTLLAISFMVGLALGLSISWL
jgi:hypothetical protein